MAKSDSSLKSLDEVARHWDDNASSWASHGGKIGDASRTARASQPRESYSEAPLRRVTGLMRCLLLRQRRELHQLVMDGAIVRDHSFQQNVAAVELQLIAVNVGDLAAGEHN